MSKLHKTIGQCPAAPVPPVKTKNLPTIEISPAQKEPNKIFPQARPPPQAADSHTPHRNPTRSPSHHAKTPATLPREVQSPRPALQSPKTEWMSVKRSSRSKVPFLLGSSPEPSLFDVADGTCPRKSCLIRLWNAEWTGWSEHDPSLRKGCASSRYTI